ncbi:hypothetical protein QJQ45_023730 [Haematococcus lacustris]|nr:hypothetical protein QJQ45_023730 [Haematococcus lacustris]
MKPDPDPRELLRETIKALERGDFKAQHSHALSTDTSLPWGIAQHVAVQQEASRVMLPGSGPPSTRSMQAGKHPGPVSLLKQRHGPAAFQPRGASHPDPFGRTAAGVASPLELSWRATVAGTPAARQAATSSLEPRSQTTPQPYTAALLATQPHGSGPGSGPTPPLQRRPGAGAAGPGALWASAPSLEEVPEAFWRTVAPDVHREMLEYVYDKECDQATGLRAMLAAVRAQSTAAAPWGSLPGLPAASTTPGGAEQQVRVVQARRDLGVEALQRGGSSSGRLSLRSALDRWSRPCSALLLAGGVKTVSRFNILFNGETEAALSLLQQAALSHQQKLQEVEQHRRNIQSLPADEAVSLPQPMARRILQRLGVQPAASLHPSRSEVSVGSATAVGRGSTRATLPATQAGRDDAGTASRLFLELDQLNISGKFGLSAGRGPGSSLVNASVAATAATAATAAASSVAAIQALARHLGHYSGWSPGRNETWRRFVMTDAGVHVAAALREVLAEFAATHNQLAYRAAFEKQTGVQLPRDLDELLAELQVESKAWHVDALVAEHQQQSLAMQEGSAQASPPEPPLPSSPGQAEQRLNAGGEELAVVQARLSQRGQRGHSASSVTARREVAELARAAASVAHSQGGGLAGVLPLYPARPVSGLSCSTEEGWGGRVEGPVALEGRKRYQGEDEPGLGYDRFLFRQRQARVKREALVADAALLAAWQQSYHYLYDIKMRDAFGINELPMRAVYRHDLDNASAARWEHYLGTRKPTAELGPSGTSGVTFHRPQAQRSDAPPSDKPAHLVAIVNQLEGTRLAEVTDLKQHVIPQLALIVVDAAQQAFEASIAGWDAPPSPSAQLLKYGNFAGLDPAVKAAQERQAALVAAGKAVDMRFEEGAYTRLTGLINQALFDALREWILTNIQVYVSGLSLYVQPHYRGPALFHLVLDAAGETLRYSPSLEAVEEQLVASVVLAVQGVNSLPGLRVVRREEATGLSFNPYALPLEVLPDLTLPPVVKEADPLLVTELTRLKSCMAACRVRCGQLLSAFHAHLSLLQLDTQSLRQQLMTTRDAMKAEEWGAAIAKYR